MTVPALTSALKRPGAVASLVQPTLVRNVYVPPGGKSLLPKRAASRKLIPGKMRPHIYHKFDCVVELSDGSTVTRRSQFPKVEWRYIADQRNNAAWNPSKANIKAIEADATGRMAKFKKKFGELDSLATSASKSSEDKSTTADDSAADDFLDLLSENSTSVQAGGKLSSAVRRKKK